jgi:ribosomal protein S9
MMERYDIRHDVVGPGWTVVDTQTDRAALRHGLPQTGLVSANAEELADEMNRHDLLYRMKTRRAQKSIAFIGARD